MDSQEGQVLQNAGYWFDLAKKRKESLTRDVNAEGFQAVFDDIKLLIAYKLANPKWGTKKIVKNLIGRCMFTERMVKKYLSFYFYNRERELCNVSKVDEFAFWTQQMPTKG